MTAEDARTVIAAANEFDPAAGLARRLEAAAIDVPVLVASGERDVVPDPWAEPTAYRGSRDVSVVVVPRMAHMHNFARTRVQLWNRIASFARTVRPKA